MTSRSKDAIQLTRRLPDSTPRPSLLVSARNKEAYSEVFFLARLRAAIDRLNQHIPAEAREEALRKVIAVERPSLIEENRRLHRALVEGIDVQFRVEDGTTRGDKLWLVDFDDPARNDWLAVNQLAVVENRAKRRPDVVIFVNGLPLAVVEVKNPGMEAATLTGAYNQFQTYKAQIPSLFRTNAVLVTTDGSSRVSARSPPMKSASCPGERRMASKLRRRAARK